MPKITELFQLKPSLTFYKFIDPAHIMKITTLLLICTTAIGAIALQPNAASADVSLSTGNQGTSISIRSSEPAYQNRVIVQPRPVIIEQKSPEWKRREEARIKEARRIAERRQELRQQESRRAAQRPNERKAEIRLAQRHYDH